MASSLIEIVYTMLLCYVYLSVAVYWRNDLATDPSSVAVLAIGLCVIAGGHASQVISDSILYTALTVGLRLMPFPIA